MGQEVVTVREGEGFRGAALQARQGRAAHAGSDHEGGLVGILTPDDLLSLLAEEITELAKLVSHERQREATART